MSWLARPEKKVAIVGFTPSRELAPWDDPTFEKWLCNNLWKFVPAGKWDRLYDLHDLDTIQSDKEHEAFLRTTTKPVYVWRPQADWGSALPFPKDEVVDAFGRYFTNSISWMIAQAIYEGATEIHVYGVDMAQGTEYAAQRPSCEYFLGYAAGRGIKVYVPPQSDLLKSAAMYGIEDDSAIRIKFDERAKELERKAAELHAQSQQVRDHQMQVAGALETTRYFRGVWINAAANRDGSAKEAPEALVSQGA
ncbi:MAG: hypothetical protein ACT452_12000 [Microthrixaceae bacterium]